MADDNDFAPELQRINPHLNIDSEKCYSLLTYIDKKKDHHIGLLDGPMLKSVYIPIQMFQNQEVTQALSKEHYNYQCTVVICDSVRPLSDTLIIEISSKLFETLVM